MLKRGIDYSRAERYTMQAYSGYKAHLPAGSEPLAKATFAHAKINFLNKDYQDSNTYFLELIKQHEQAGVPEHPRVLQAYAFMVQNYEELGESDQATIYTRKIGQARPWDDNQDQKPVYLPVPDYQVPTSSGFGRIKNKYESEWSRYRLTIDESGFVSDFELQDSSGNKRLNKAIEKVLPKWRFAPKFVDGKAVVADTYFTFELKF
jgi:TonB family protein